MWYSVPYLKESKTADDEPAKKPGRCSLTMSDRFLASFLATGKYHAYEVINGLPSDARVIGCTLSSNFEVILLIESMEWPELSEGISPRHLAQPQVLAFVPPP